MSDRSRDYKNRGKIKIIKMSGRFLPKFSVAELRSVCTFPVDFTCSLTTVKGQERIRSVIFQESVVFGNHCQACRRKGVTVKNKIYFSLSLLHTLLLLLSSTKAGRE